jgi:hypothetical protein
MGARRLSREHGLPCSHQVVSRVLRDCGLIQKRRKKHKKKKDLAQIKPPWKLFGQISVDTKDFSDILHSWPQRKALGLPRYQFTAREVRSGMMFLAYGQEKSASNAYLLIRLLLGHLRAVGIEMEGLRCQTDNGSEFIGCTRQDRTRDGFETVVEGMRGPAQTPPQPRLEL